jgi:hypothetical protein
MEKSLCFIVGILSAGASFGEGSGYAVTSLTFKIVPIGLHPDEIMPDY